MQYLLKDRVLLVLLVIAAPNALGAWLWARFSIEVAAIVLWFLISGLTAIVVTDARLTAKERKAKRQRKQIIEGDYDYV